jgi:hypothetical protein
VKELVFSCDIFSLDLKHNILVFFQKKMVDFNIC